MLKSASLALAISLFLPFANAELVCSPTAALNNSWERALHDSDQKQIKSRLAEVRANRTEGSELLQVKPVHVLDSSAAAKRQKVVDSAGDSTTDRRSEFKHYPTKAASDKIIAQMRKDYPPVFDEKGNLLSGIASRDFRPKLPSSETQKILGDDLFAKAKQNDFMALVQYNDVLLQHEVTLQKKLQSSLKELAESKGLKISDTELEKQAKDKLAKLKQAQLTHQSSNLTQTRTFTDTASTEKFSWRVDLSPTAIDEAIVEANEVKKLSRPLSSDNKLELSKFDYQNGTADDLYKIFAKHGHSKDETERIYEAVKARSMNEGVLRYRQYRDGPENASYDGIASPGTRGSESKNDFVDSPFSKGFIWVEAKMKNTKGESVRRTAGDKPRNPFTPAMVETLQDPTKFIDERAFQMTKAKLKEQLKENYKIHQSRGNKEAYNEEKVDAEIEFFRELHKQGFNFKPIGRTSYTRESWNANIPQESGKPMNNQITRDTNVVELDRKTGKMVQALPYTDVDRKWQFQYNPQSEYYEHVDQATGQVLHVMHPQSRKVYGVDQEGYVSNVSIPANLTPTEVTELKVGINYIGLTDADIAKVPGLAPIRQFRRDLIRETESLNALRSAEGLPGFAVDKGKRSTSRKSISSAEWLEVNGTKTRFEFNAESGLYVQWVKGKAVHVYHPEQGVQKIVRDPMDISKWTLEDVSSKKVTTVKTKPRTLPSQPPARHEVPSQHAH